MYLSNYEYVYYGPSYTGDGWYIFKGHAVNGNVGWETVYSENYYRNERHSNQLIFVYENKRL